MNDGGVFLAATPTSRLAMTGRFKKTVDEWLLSCYVEDCTPATIETYAKMLRWFGEYLETLDPEPSFDEISTRHISGYLETIKRRGVAPRTVKGRFGAIYTFFQWAVRLEYLESNPAKLLKRPRAPKRPKRFLTQGEFESIIEVCPPDNFIGARRQATFRLLLTSGIRLNELVNLEITDLDYQKGQVWVRHGKGQKERQASFHKSAQKAMARYLRFRRDKCPALWVVKMRYESRPMTYNGLENDIRRVMGYAGVEIKDKAHALRRTMASIALSAKVEREHVQAVGGWETSKILDLYVQWKKTEQDAALEAVRDVDPWA